MAIPDAETRATEFLNEHGEWDEDGRIVNVPALMANFARTHTADYLRAIAHDQHNLGNIGQSVAAMLRRRAEELEKGTQ